MLTTILSIETINANLLLGFMPESLGLLIFGAVLITSAVGLRLIFNQNEKNNFDCRETNANQNAIG